MKTLTALGTCVCLCACLDERPQTSGAASYQGSAERSVVNLYLDKNYPTTQCQSSGSYRYEVRGSDFILSNNLAQVLQTPIAADGSFEFRTTTNDGRGNIVAKRLELVNKRGGFGCKYLGEFSK